ncbi:MAG: hypothetical protein RBR86_09065 [Pseudobdellovibrionaceae bacterium]|jgi:hypothetical protein|nr:hypothetical protein [Pseudobdellovibrionaceae bacterium]
MSILDRLLGRPPAPVSIPRGAVSIPADYLGLNAKYAGTDATHAYFPLMKILKGFLLFDRNLYLTNVNKDGLDASVDFLTDTHECLGTMTAQHLSNKGNREVIDYCEAFHEETSGYLSYLEYRVSLKDQFDRAVKFDWSSLIMGKFNLDGDGKLLTLMFCITGFNIMPNDGQNQAHIVPVDVFCRSGEDGLLVPSNAISLTSAMAYANQAFIQLAGGMKFDPSANETWFEDRRLEEADRICGSLESRTMASLDEDILQYERLCGLAP